MLLEIAIGDSYGAGFEFCSREKINQHNTLAAFVPHELGIPAGHYTDDTQMSIAVAEVLLQDDWTSDAFASAFVRVYRRNPRAGYAKGFQALLDQCADGPALRQTIRPNSTRNGAAMRAVPLGLIDDKGRLAETARAQAVVTHDTKEGVLSAHSVALMAHLLIYDGAEIAMLPSLVERYTGLVLRGDWQGEVACDGLQTVHAVYSALARNRTFSGLLKECINFGGDVDSVAAIALGLASLSPEYVSDLPLPLLQGLETGCFGTTFLVGLDEALAARFPVLPSVVGKEG